MPTKSGKEIPLFVSFVSVGSIWLQNRWEVRSLAGEEQTFMYRRTQGLFACMNALPFVI